mmetsp:Transcript_21551/g.31885  ORF Transcript_21551/g.31885 Transcript_21551/m.31885 type:complete len:310 (+) Transcript_21551:2-931(+)
MFLSVIIFNPSMINAFVVTHHNSHRTTALHGVLSKADILRSRKNTQHSDKSREKPNLTLDFISEAIEEAIFRQEKILDALSNATYNNSRDNQNKTNYSDSVAKRQEEVATTLTKLLVLRQESNDLKDIRNLNPSKPRKERTKHLGETLEILGFHSLLRVVDQDQYSIHKERRKEFGRPKGFDGLVFTSPAGVPILVGREKAHGDGTLRRVSQGSDLWFQVADYDGSRVLLRTSVRRGMKGSKVCLQMAADLAAFYSRHRNDDYVRVMYTDSKNVAKRGSKAGQMRQSKVLGHTIGHPTQVEQVARGKEP